MQLQQPPDTSLSKFETGSGAGWKEQQELMQASPAVGINCCWRQCMTCLVWSDQPAAARQRPADQVVVQQAHCMLLQLSALPRHAAAAHCRAILLSRQCWHRRTARYAPNRDLFTCDVQPECSPKVHTFGPYFTCLPQGSGVARVSTPPDRALHTALPAPVHRQPA